MGPTPIPRPLYCGRLWVRRIGPPSILKAEYSQAVDCMGSTEAPENSARPATPVTRNPVA
jgi:hypothetical protein